jgi:transitional endoplasmic reticulum ATPase
LCRKLAGRNGAAILVIDEAEDLFLAGVEQRGSKLWLNKLVEDGKGPHIWIVNDAWLLGEPVVRRMDMAIRFDMPSGSARRAIVQRLVSNQITPLVADESDGKRLVEALADLHASPAILSAAMRTGAAMDGDAGCMISLARDLAEASGRTVVTPYTSHGAVFDPALSVADCDLVSLADKLAAATQNWSLLLSGPPGTGKSAYARHLAECAGCDLICRSGAELLGMYVGETEKQIASAFAEAERSKAILLIDEADSFLANRDTASRNWEVSMTNEMLRQMEGGRVRFLATTNRAASLDPASARRFTMRAEFSALDGARARKLFEASFGSAAPISLDRTAGLTPGDFAQVSQRAKLLCEADPERLVEWLADALKLRDGSKAKIGF